MQVKIHKDWALPFENGDQSFKVGSMEVVEGFVMDDHTCNHKNGGSLSLTIRLPSLSLSILFLLVSLSLSLKWKQPNEEWGGLKVYKAIEWISGRDISCKN